ncbi:hypothetical protein D9758_007838 [Tetrapyrgos nigripes]|uniref:GH18 domain-containing protein n=1 Tax=Tetrapyrgos nigripes TaxID=182062 RepID=A0A8H5CYD2_9AGAR|nr:hypothetical protein D9758_007838 [Tetrapyrgos nigripes]
MFGRLLTSLVGLSILVTVLGGPVTLDKRVPMFDQNITAPHPAPKVVSREPMFDQNITAPHHVARAANAVPSAPRFVVYADKFVPGQTGPPPVDQVKGYNVFALSFLLTSGPFDKALEWTQLSDADRASIKQQYNAAGISLVVSAFGATDAPTSAGADPTATANTFANFVKQWGLDGIDIDYEVGKNLTFPVFKRMLNRLPQDFNAFNAQDGSAENWLSTFTTAIRAQLPQGQFIVTHAPVAPWFSTAKFPRGYTEVHKNVGNLIDWYNLQFYNQGTTEYTTCDGLLTTSSATWPNSALFQIASNSGVPLDKLVIGKPATSGDANNGFIDPSTLATCANQAKSQGWNGGVMVWEYPDATASWIQSVRALAFPV